jgi:hypothetical protein
MGKMSINKPDCKGWSKYLILQYPHDIAIQAPRASGNHEQSK